MPDPYLDYQFELPEPPLLREQLSQAIDTWTERNKLIKRMREMLTGQNPISAPASTQYRVKVAHSYYLLAAVNEKMARFLDRPRIQVVAQGVGQTARDHSTKLEHWINEAFSALDKNSGTSVWGAVTRDALSFDLGVERIERAPAAFWPELFISGEDNKSNLMRMYEDPKLYEKMKDEYLKKAGLPIRSVYVPPDSYFPIYEGPTPVQEFQIEQRSLRSVMRNKMFNTEHLAKFPTGSDGGMKTMVTILHVVNGKYHAYYALCPSTTNGQWPKPATPDMMNIGQPALLYAYEHGLNRSLYNAVSGRFAGYRNQQDWVEGAVLDALCSSNQDMDEILSQAMTVHRATSWVTPVAYYDPEMRSADEHRPKPPVIQEGQPIAMWTTERLGTLYEAKPNPMFESIWGKLSERIDALAGASVLFGQRTPGVDTGYHQELQISQAEHLDEKIEEHLSDGAVNRAEIILEHVRKIGERVYVTPVEKDSRGRYFGQPIAITPADITQMPTMAAKVRGTSPLNVAANLRAAIEATTVRQGHNRPLYDDQTALERFMGEDAPDEVQAKIDIQEEQQKLRASGVLTEHISRKMNMMLVKEGTPNITSTQTAGSDPALQQAIQALNAGGAPVNNGGVDPNLLTAAMEGREMSGVVDSNGGLGYGSYMNGQGGGMPTGQPQPEQQAGLALSRGAV